MSGTISVLNVGAGDLKITFDKDNPLETVRAQRVVKDMLARGYAIFIEVGLNEDGKTKRYSRVYSFVENTNEYVIADLDPEFTHSEYVPQDSTQGKTDEPGSNGKPKRRVKRVSADSTSGVAVARSAGG